MTEQQLISLGFTKLEINANESGANPYYYYSLQLGYGDCCLSTPADDEINDDHWPVYEMNLKLEIIDYEKLSQFIIAFNNLL